MADFYWYEMKKIFLKNYSMIFYLVSVRQPPPLLPPISGHLPRI